MERVWWLLPLAVALVVGGLCPLTGTVLLVQRRVHWPEAQKQPSHYPLSILNPLQLLPKAQLLVLTLLMNSEDLRNLKENCHLLQLRFTLNSLRKLKPRMRSSVLK